jgi:hypothetical protein
MDTGAWRAIIPDPIGPHPACRCRPAAGGPGRSPAGLPGDRPRTHAPSVAAVTPGRDHGRCRGADRRPVHDRDGRVGRGCPQPVREALGTRRDAPAHWVVPYQATIRRTLVRLDPEALAGVIGAWLADRDHPGQRPRAVAVDAKRLGGACRGGRQVQLLAAMEHTTPRVLAQPEVDGAPGEVPGLKPLLERLDLAGVVVTADAFQTHAEAADSWSPSSRRTTGSPSRPTSPPSGAAASGWPGTTCRCWTAPATRHTAGWPSAPSRRSAWVASAASRAPPRSSRSPPRSATLGPGRGRPRQLRGHQPGPRPGQPGQARRLPRWPLGDRERAA